MSLKDKFTQLPETLAPDETRNLFLQLLALPLATKEEDLLEHIEVMAEIADRQWHTYTLLNEDIRCKLDTWVSLVWNRQSVNRARLLIGIIARVGLVRSMKFLQEELKAELHPLVTTEIMDAIKEFGATVGNPYSGMQKGQEAEKSCAEEV